MKTQLQLLLDPEIELDSSIIFWDSDKWDYAVSEFTECTSFALDIETYGEQKKKEEKKNRSANTWGLNPWKGEIRLIQIGLPSGKTMIIDFGSPYDDREKQINQFIESYFFKVFRKQLFSRDIIVLLHNAQFDLLWLKVKFGLNVRGIYDSMLMSRILRAGLQKDRLHSLKQVAKDFLNEDLEKELQTSDWAYPKLSNAQFNYGAYDVQILFPLKEKLDQRLLQSKLWLQRDIENNAVPAIVEMIFNGMPVDISKVEEALALYVQCQNEVLQPFYEVFGYDTPYTMQAEKLTHLIYEKLGITVESTGKDDLNLNNDVPSLKALGTARSLKKHIDYLTAMRDKVHIDDDGNGWLRGDISQIAPKGYGRTTCKEGEINGINLQQVPKPMYVDGYSLPSIRSLFHCPSGYKLLIDDLSQAHLRIAAQASGDKNLIEIYNEDKDFHSITASQLANQQNLEWSPDDIAQWKEDKAHHHHKQAKHFRNIAKNVNYGGANIQGAKTLQKTARNAGTFIDLDTAKQGIQSFREVAPDLYKYQKYIFNKACNTSFPFNGQDYAYTRAFSGRRVYLPKYKNDFKNGEVEPKINDVCAVHWTSTEADAIKYAMGKLMEDIDAHSEWNFKLGIIAHDELDGVIKEQYAVEGATALKHRMWEGMRLFIKDIPVDGNDATPEECVCTSWQDK